MDQWQEIHGFGSPGAYEAFLAYIDRQVGRGCAEEISADPKYSRGEIYGGRWFRNLETNEVWRVVAPDYPFRGLWEPVFRLQMTESDSEIEGAEALLFAEILRIISADAESWTVEYCDEQIGEHWLLDYPDAEMQGGGSPRLRRIPGSS